ncbi:MAG TPA: O-antigen ligase family protein [Candidatus Gastranaerophilales bacterium]|nr:O-antigen ligase family protein [Candidatus Gastranaerophilales bacterium]
MNNLDVNPIILGGFLFTAFMLFVFMIHKSIKNPIIPYVMLQLIFMWILVGQKFLSPVGLDFKPHATVFLLSLTTSGYFLIAKFKELWNYKPFRYLFIFFTISTIYAFFYKTDFRSSSYIDLWIQNNLGLRFSALRSGVETMGRDFGSSETKFLVYLAGLTPLCAFLTGFMAFWKKADIEELRNNLYSLISAISSGVFVYYILLAVSVMIGHSSAIIMANRLLIDGGFAGGSFEAPFLMLMAAFYFILNTNYEKFKFYSVIKGIISANISVLALLIIMGIKKGTFLSLGIALITAFIIIYVVKKLTGKSFIDEETSKKPTVKENNIIFHPVMFFIPLLLIAPIALIQSGMAEDLVYSITDRFSSSGTFDIRMINWNMYITHWLNNLDFFKVIFGFGIDTSREATFFLTAMHPDPSFQQPHIHNLFLEMFYNYGLMALFFFLPFIFILRKSLKDLFVEPLKTEVKIFNVLSISMMVYFFFFGMAESPSMIAMLIAFGLFGFFESVRISMGHAGKLPYSSKLPF